MSAATPTHTGDWTRLLAAAVAHDINNLAHGFSISDAAEWEGFVADCVGPLRKLGARLRTLAAAGEGDVSARVDDACADALAEVDPEGGRVRRAGPLPGDARARGTAAAVRTAIASLLEHALAASPPAATIQLDVRDGERGAVVIEISAPDATTLGTIGTARLDALLATALRDLRGDFPLVLAGAAADALGGAVYVTSSAQTGLVLALQLVRA